MSEVEISKHAMERLRERFGLKKRAIRRYVDSAWKFGTLPHESDMKQIADRYAKRQQMTAENLYLIYMGRVFIFGINPAGKPVLVTAYDPTTREDGETFYLKGQRVKKYTVRHKCVDGNLPITAD